MKRSEPTEAHQEESKRLLALWDIRRTLSQAEFGRAFNVGNQSYVWQCLHGKVILNLKTAMAFATHLRCPLYAFSTRLDDELAVYVNFDNEQRALIATDRLFTRRELDEP